MHLLLDKRFWESSSRLLALVCVWFKQMRWDNGNFMNNGSCVFFVCVAFDTRPLWYGSLIFKSKQIAFHRIAESKSIFQWIWSMIVKTMCMCVSFQREEKNFRLKNTEKNTHTEYMERVASIMINKMRRKKSIFFIKL